MDGQFQPYQALQMLGQGHQVVAASARTFTFIGSCVSNGSALNFGALSVGSVTAGDLLVYIDFAFDTVSPVPSAVTPSGFTNVVNDLIGAGVSFARGMVSVKNAAGGEGSITGLNDAGNNKVGLVFRPSTAFTTITANDIATEIAVVNPASQSCDPSAETTAVILIGVACIDGGTAAFSTASPAFDATIATADADLLAGYKIYNTSPAAHTIDMNDLGGNNWLASLYLTVT